MSGYHEIQSPRQRKGTIDHKALCELLGLSTIEQLQNAHNGWVDDHLMQSRRDPVWTANVAVGDEFFLVNLKLQLDGTLTEVRPDAPEKNALTCDLTTIVQ